MADRTHEPSPRELVAEHDGFVRTMDERNKWYERELTAIHRSIAANELAIMKAEDVQRESRLDQQRTRVIAVAIGVGLLLQALVTFAMHFVGR